VLLPPDIEPVVDLETPINIEPDYTGTVSFTGFSSIDFDESTDTGRRMKLGLQDGIAITLVVNTSTVTVGDITDTSRRSGVVVAFTVAAGTNSNADDVNALLTSTSITIGPEFAQHFVAAAAAYGLTVTAPGNVIFDSGSVVTDDDAGGFELWIIIIIACSGGLCCLGLLGALWLYCRTRKDEETEKEKEKDKPIVDPGVNPVKDPVRDSFDIVKKADSVWLEDIDAQVDTDPGTLSVHTNNVREEATESDPGTLSVYTDDPRDEATDTNQYMDSDEDEEQMVGGGIQFSSLAVEEEQRLAAWAMNQQPVISQGGSDQPRPPAAKENDADLEQWVETDDDDDEYEAYSSQLDELDEKIGQWEDSDTETDNAYQHYFDAENDQITVEQSPYALQLTPRVELGQYVQQEPDAEAALRQYMARLAAQSTPTVDNGDNFATQPTPRVELGQYQAQPTPVVNMDFDAQPTPNVDMGQLAGHPTPVVHMRFASEPTPRVEMGQFAPEPTPEVSMGFDSQPTPRVEMGHFAAQQTPEIDLAQYATTPRVEMGQFTAQPTPTVEMGYLADGATPRVEMHQFSSQPAAIDSDEYEEYVDSDVEYIDSDEYQEEDAGQKPPMFGVRPEDQI